jgi:NADPH-dependent curcumin reductase
MLNRQWILARRPTGRIEPGVLELRQVPVSLPDEGQALIQNLYLSLDPTHRIWMSDMPQYMPPVALGEVMRAGTLARVVQSRTPELAPGDLVSAQGGYQDYALVQPQAVSRINPVAGTPLVHYMGLLSHIGATAYFGLLEIGQPQPGQTVVVSGAAGAVGSIAGQLAKISQARVIGIAGSAAKCGYVTGELGFDAAIDYRREDVAARLRTLAPQGVDVYFDNTGGDILDAVLQNLALNARIALCGLIASYNAQGEWAGPRYYRNLLMKRAMVKGFIVSDYRARFGEVMPKLAAWHAQGLLKYRVDVQPGLENAPAYLNRLFDGDNQGKLVVQISNDHP